MPAEPPAATLAAALAAESAAVGIPLTHPQIDGLLRFSDLIAQWNSRARLTALVDPFHVVRLHFVDSLLCLRATAFPSGAAVIDVGSGAGLPGIPLAIARPDLEMTLLEANARKAAFLELAVSQLDLPCEVVAARAEVAGHRPVLREKFDIAVARAVAPLNRLVEWTLPFVRLRGSAVLLKGPSVTAEIAGALGMIETLGGISPRMVAAQLAGGERRMLVLMRKVSPTPEPYPRQITRRSARA